MRFPLGALVPTSLVAISVFGCGDPVFKAGPANAGLGGTPAETSSEPVGGSGDGGSAAGGNAPAPACQLDHLVMSEVRSRGPAGGADEFIELFNPTEADVTLDSSWVIEGKNAASSATSAYTARWLGGGNVIVARGHRLITGSSYTQSPPGDEALSISIPDAASLRLMHGGSTVDALCYYFDQTTQGLLATDAFTCEGDPVSNLPHDDTASGNLDTSIERGTCADPGNNAADFVSSAPATPLNAASPVTP